MDFWIKAAQLILSLSILVVLHEFGHYIPAKLFKTRVEKFYLFFDPWFSLFKKKIGDTEWGIGWLPLGGYVKISGMVDESMDKEQLALPPQPHEFRSKKAWQRLIIMIGGVTVNLILGILIYIFVIYAWGYEKLDNNELKAGLAVHPYIEQYGFIPGDIIENVEGKVLDTPLEVSKEVFLRGARTVQVKHLDGKSEKIYLPEDVEYKLFKEDAFPMFSLRTRMSKINHFVALHDFSEEIKQHDAVYKANGKVLTCMEDLNTKGKVITLEIIREDDTIKTSVQKESFLKKVASLFPAMYAGLRKGDKIKAVNGQKTDFYDEMQSTFYKNKMKSITLSVYRGEEIIEIDAKLNKDGRLGILVNPRKSLDMNAIKTIEPTFWGSISKGWDRGFRNLGDYAGQLKFIFTKKGASSIGGFGSIGKMFAPTWDWEVFWGATALLSIILAFMNILPIPALDGGHVVFLIYEMVTGKEAPQKVLEYAQYVGFVLLLGLLIYANGNDIYRAIFG